MAKPFSRPSFISNTQLGLLCLSLLLCINSNAEEVIGAEQGETETVNAVQVISANSTEKEPAEQPKAAENINLSEPVLKPPVIPPSQTTETPTDNQTPPTKKPAATPQKEEQTDWLFLNTIIPPATTTRLSWSPDQSFEGIATPTPILVAHGAHGGPKLCLTAAVHGDELNGIEIIRRVMYNIDAKELRGTVIGVPIVNLQGFLRSSRYLSDRRDLNRYFPGNLTGSNASRIAYSFFNQIIVHCDMLVDIHTGSFYRTNLPQIRANLKKKNVFELSKSFDAIAVLHGEGAVGTLRKAAVDFGIPAVTLEAGGPMELNESDVAQGVTAINTLLDKRGMLDTLSFWGAPQPAFYGSLWVRANQGGILFSEVELGAKVKKGDKLGSVTDPVTNMRSVILSPVNGRIIGKALNQFVQPGFAAYHIGTTAKVASQLIEGSLPPVMDDTPESDDAGPSISGGVESND